MKKYLLAIVFTAVPFTSFASFDSNVSYGQSSPQVYNLQAFLKTQDCFTPTPTGYFGTVTFQAVKCFQIANSISPTGYFGPLSRAAANFIQAQVAMGAPIDEGSMPCPQGFTCTIVPQEVSAPVVTVPLVQQQNNAILTPMQDESPDVPIPESATITNETIVPSTNDGESVPIISFLLTAPDAQLRSMTVHFTGNVVNAYLYSTSSRVSAEAVKDGKVTFKGYYNGVEGTVIRGDTKYIISVDATGPATATIDSTDISLVDIRQPFNELVVPITGQASGSI